jgi:hypothetical protein
MAVILLACQLSQRSPGSELQTVLTSNLNPAGKLASFSMFEFHI